MSEKNPFHLAVTMAGAVSAGAYTAGVMDYLLECLEKWTRLKTQASAFFAVFEDLRDHTWEVIENRYFTDNDLKKARLYDPAWAALETEDLENRLRRAAKLYNAIPRHDVKIEILSGASAGGMTAAISSLVLHLPDKHPVDFDAKETEKKKNRLYDSWVNLSDEDMMPVLLGDSDILAVRRREPHAKFPVSLLNSQFVRKIASEALDLSDEECARIGLPAYVAEDFHLFVTMTNLRGYQRVVRIDANNQAPGRSYPSDFITYDHRDLAMFNFSEKKRDEPGVINIDFKIRSENMKLLRNAAISTGAFPIGLEYGFYDVETRFIKENVLMRSMYGDFDELTTHNYRSAMIDGGLINNEPFELTEDLLFDRLKKFYGEKEDAIRKRRNYTILMIDPFPSEKRQTKSEAADENKPANEHPYSFLEAIGQLLSTVRSQLLVKPKLIKRAFDETDFSCFLIAPKRRVFQKDKNGALIKQNGRYLPEFELDENGQRLADESGNPIPAVYNGSLAIACGALGGFGGFLAKDFRKHDFRLGQINCKSFLRNHFRFRRELQTTNPVFANAYENDAAEIFKIQDDGKFYFPLIPDLNVVEDILDGKCSRSDIANRSDIEELYGKLKYPRYDMKKFDELKSIMFVRLNYLLVPYLENMLAASWSGKLIKPIALPLIKSKLYGTLFGKIRATVEKQLTDWQLIRQ